MSKSSPNKKIQFKAGIAEIDPGHFCIRSRVRVDGKIVERREDFHGKKEGARLRREELKKELYSKLVGCGDIQKRPVKKPFCEAGGSYYCPFRNFAISRD